MAQMSHLLGDQETLGSPVFMFLGFGVGVRWGTGRQKELCMEARNDNKGSPLNSTSMGRRSYCWIFLSCP